MPHFGLTTVELEFLLADRRIKWQVSGASCQNTARNVLTRVAFYLSILHARETSRFIARSFKQPLVHNEREEVGFQEQRRTCVTHSQLALSVTTSTYYYSIGIQEQLQATFWGISYATSMNRQESEGIDLRELFRDM